MCEQTKPCPDTPDGRHDFRVTDDSFANAFGTERVRPYLECNTCGETASIPFPRQREP